MKLVFLTEHSRVALTRFCTWLMTLINSLDEQEDEADFVYAVPVLFVDIPFELFRAMLRALTGEETFEDDLHKPATKVGILA
mmetsp:Transcript_3976/g.4804  ORF Transcript_3976/g.4804 Transcript_3976/m.4804 type:complete len:82 (+) Transcript_3976:2420-2665(+)